MDDLETFDSRSFVTRMLGLGKAAVREGCGGWGGVGVRGEDGGWRWRGDGAFVLETCA